MNHFYKLRYYKLDYDVTDKETHAFVTVNVVPARRVLDTVLHNSPVKERLKPSMEAIQTKNGTIIHRFELDGIANICFRSNSASKKLPQRFGFRLETSENDPRMLLPKGEGEGISDSATNVDEHLSHMERELQRITIAMNHVLREADFNKDQDTLFHKQTLAMHSATTFWPIVQVCILLITGFTQANHIVRFFKSRRII
jgi:emp24/gp25L/p24 family/GOLD